MKIPELRKVVHTYKDFELKHLAQIARWCENTLKERVYNTELKRRENERSEGNYTDNTLNPKVNFKDRLSRVKLDNQ